jgi:capsular polysaccharide biosynthesis protein
LKQKADQHQDLVEEQTKLHARVAAASASLQDYSSRFSRLSNNSTKGLGVLESPERIKLIDMASNPTVPSDSGARIILTGIAAGVALALGMALLAELMDQRVRRAEDVADVLGLPSVVKLR